MGGRCVVLLVQGSPTATEVKKGSHTLSDQRGSGHGVSPRLLGQHTVCFHRAAPLRDPAAVGSSSPPATAEAAVKTAVEATGETAGEAAPQDAAPLSAQCSGAQHPILPNKHTGTAEILCQRASMDPWNSYKQIYRQFLLRKKNQP